MICVQEGRLQPKPALVGSEINPWRRWMVSECLPGAGFSFWTLPVGWTSSFRGQSRTGLLPTPGVRGERSLPCQCGWEQGHVTAEPKGSSNNAKPHSFGFEVEKNAFWLRLITIFSLHSCFQNTSVIFIYLSM